MANEIGRMRVSRLCMPIANLHQIQFVPPSGAVAWGWTGSGRQRTPWEIVSATTICFARRPATRRAPCNPIASRGSVRIVPPSDTDVLVYGAAAGGVMAAVAAAEEGARTVLLAGMFAGAHKPRPGVRSGGP